MIRSQTSVTAKVSPMIYALVARACGGSRVPIPVQCSLAARACGFSRVPVPVQWSLAARAFGGSRVPVPVQRSLAARACGGSRVPIPVQRGLAAPRVLHCSVVLWKPVWTVREGRVRRPTLPLEHIRYWGDQCHWRHHTEGTHQILRGPVPLMIPHRGNTSDTEITSESDDTTIPHRGNT